MTCSDIRIRDTVFAGNSGGPGGAIFGSGEVTITGCTFIGDDILIEQLGSVGTVNNSIISNAGCLGPITSTCTNVFGISQGDSLCGIDGGGNFSADPEFCGVDPVASRNFALQADSPCAPGRHPNGASCGLIGAVPVGCDAVSVEATTWSRLKSLYR